MSKDRARLRIPLERLDPVVLSAFGGSRSMVKSAVNALEQEIAAAIEQLEEAIDGIEQASSTHPLHELDPSWRSRRMERGRTTFLQATRLAYDLARTLRNVTYPPSPADLRNLSQIDMLGRIRDHLDTLPRRQQVDRHDYTNDDDERRVFVRKCIRNLPIEGVYPDTANIKMEYKGRFKGPGTVLGYLAWLVKQGRAVKGSHRHLVTDASVIRGYFIDEELRQAFERGGPAAYRVQLDHRRRDGSLPLGYRDEDLELHRAMPLTTPASASRR